MTVESKNDVDGLKEVGRIVALTISEMKRQTRVGMTTQELDEIGGQFLRRHGAVSAPQSTYNFPGNTCISINHEVAHGVPGNRKIQEGDLINIDVSAELNGYFADAGQSFQIPMVDPSLTRLCLRTQDTLMKVISQLRQGVKMNEIGRIIQSEARKSGYKVIMNLCSSHGVGKALHEKPDDILPFYDPNDQRVLEEGLVIAVEPFLTTEAQFVDEGPDGWTLSVPDDSWCAQHEHTL